MLGQKLLDGGEVGTTPSHVGLDENELAHKLGSFAHKHDREAAGQTKLLQNLRSHLVSILHLANAQNDQQILVGVEVDHGLVQTLGLALKSLSVVVFLELERCENSIPARFASAVSRG